MTVCGSRSFVHEAAAVVSLLQIAGRGVCKMSKEDGFGDVPVMLRGLAGAGDMIDETGKIMLELCVGVAWICGWYGLLGLTFG